MSRFNSAAATHTTTNLAGGTAYAMTPELELVSALLTSFLEDKFYQSGQGRMDAIKNAMAKVDPLFAAKAAIYARNEFGMRSVSHVTAAELFRLGANGKTRVAGQEWVKRFIDKVVRRPDDATEIVSYYFANVRANNSEPGALKKGLALALAKFDEYQLAKYRSVGKSIKLVDIANLVHPAHSEAIKKLIDDELRNQNTFEVKLSEAGKSDAPDAKKEAWADLVTSGKLGYFALLRNLRNIIEQAPEVIDRACEQLKNEKAIRQSLVLPFRFLTAADEIGKLAGPEAKKVLMALNAALDVSAVNLPKFEGETLVAVDRSGSMQGEPLKRAALFAAMLVKSNLADVILWDDAARDLTCNPADSTLTIANQIARATGGSGGTNIAAPFQHASRAYDRIVILTDEQSWLHDSQSYFGYGARHTGPSALAEYKRRTMANPFVYDWDLQGYGTLQFPENQVAMLAGWSDKVFDIMKLVETDKKALVHTIERVEI